MTEAVYVTEDGKKYDYENLERKEKCTFCGELGDVPGEDELLDGQLPSLHGEPVNGSYANICRNCLQEGVSKEALNEAIGAEEEMQEKEVELS